MEGRQKILVIEDDESLLKNISDLLQEEGYKVFNENNGLSGVEAAKKIVPDLIICDISMPLMDGYEVLKNIQMNEATKNTPFIFLTAKVEKEDIRKGMQLGADDYIFKPFDIDDLLNSVKIRLKRHEIRDRNGEQEFEKFYKDDDKLFLKFGRNYQYVFIKEIKYLRASTPYIKIKTKSGKTTLVRESLNEWEKRLPAKMFMRIHRNSIINLEFISKMEKISSGAYIIKLQEETEPFIVSKRFATKIRRNF